jgi:hypothetical protein
VDRSWDYINPAHGHMNAEIGTEAAQFPEKEHINGIFDAVYSIPCEIRHFSDNKSKNTRRSGSMTC